LTTQDEDPIEAERRRFAQALATGAYENPDRVAADRQEAAARGLPVSALRDARAAGPLPPLVNFHALRQNAPRTIDFLSDPHNAVVAQDDITTLQDTESLLAGRRDLERIVPRGFLSAEETRQLMEQTRARNAQVQGQSAAKLAPARFIERQGPAGRATANLFRGAGEGAARLAGGLGRTSETLFGPADDFLRRQLERVGVPLFDWETDSSGRLRMIRGSSARDAATPGVAGQALIRAAENPSFGYEAGTSWEDVKRSPAANVIPYALETGVVSVPDMALAVASLPVYVYSRTGSIGQSRAENDLRQEATVEDLVAALPAAAASALLERIGTRGIIGLDDVLKNGLRGVPAAAGSAALKEALTEAAQSGIEYAGTNLFTETGFDPVVALDQMAAGAVAGGPFGGTVRAATATIESQLNRNANAQLQSQRAESGARMVEQLGVLAAASKLNAREAQTFQQFVDMAAEDGPVTDIYIASETLFQSANGTDLDLNALAAAVPHVAEQIRSGASDIRMTVGEYAAHVAGTEANTALLDHLRTDPLGVSRADAKEQLANLDATVQQDFSKAFERSAEAEAAMASRDVVAGQIAAKLNTTGRFTSDVNQRYGMIVANFYSTLGARRGMSAEQMAELLPLAFDAELPGTKQDNTLSQEESVDLIHFSSTPGIMTSDPSLWGSAGVTQNSERERRNAGAPGRTYFGVRGVYNGEPETGISGRSFRYQARVPASKLYDFDADPQGLKPTEGTAMEIATAYEKAIQAAGFSGYRSDAMIPGAVAVFDAVGMEPMGPVRTTQDAQRLAARMRELAQQDRLARLAARTDPEESIATRPAEDFREQALSELFGSSYAQTGVPLLDNPLPVEGKLTIKAVAKALTDHHMATEGRKLYPENDEADYARVRDAFIAEVRAQLLQPNSGVGWYSADVQKAVEMAGRVYPKLLTEPSHRSLYLTFAGFFSSGLDPDQAFMLASEAYEAYLATGVIPASREAAWIARGLPVQMTTFKSNKTGEMVTQPKGWGPRNPDNNKMLAIVAHLVEREGSLQAAMDWFITPQSRTDINAAMLDSGIYKAGRYTTKAEIAGPDKPGYLVFGLKLGPYTMGLQGYDIDPEDVTVDLWYIRTYRRHIGRLFEGPIDPKTGIVAQPSEKDDGVDRRAIVRLTSDLVEEFNLPTGDVQALLWFFEKRLWAAQGIRTNEGTNSSGAAKLLRSKGIDPNDGDGGRVPANRAFPADGGVFNQGPVPRSVAEYFSPENVADLLSKDDWAVLTAENPMGQQATPEDNAKAQAKLVADLDALGVDYQPSIGRYGQIENSFVVTGINEAQARELGKKYNQDSVLTRKGLIYQDGRIDAATGVTVHDTRPEDYFTEVPGTGALFTVDLDFSRADITKGAAFKAWFGDSKVVDAKGEPLVVYRGQHSGSADPETRLGSYTFGGRGTASLYAMEPNDRSRDAEAVAPFVIPAYLSIQNPIVDNRDGDPYIDMSTLIDAVGLDKVTAFAKRNASSLENTNTWEELNDEFEDVARLIERAPERLGELPMLAYEVLEDPTMLEQLKEAGFDGAIHGGMGENYDELEYRVFDESQIKSVFNNGAFDPADPRILYQADPFYSALERAVEQSPLTKAPAAQWLATLSKTAGVKKEEIEITGLSDWLDLVIAAEGEHRDFLISRGQVDAKGNIPKEAVLAFVRANGVELEETVLGKPGLPFDTEVYVMAEGDGWQVQDQYSTPLSPMFETEEEAQAASDALAEEQQLADSFPTQFDTYSFAKEAVPSSYREFLLRMPTFKDDAFDSVEGHFAGFTDVLAFVQLSEHTDAEGKRTMFLSAVQSSHHQAGRDKGYKSDVLPAQIAEAEQALEDARKARIEAERAILPIAERLIVARLDFYEAKMAELEAAGATEWAEQDIRDVVEPEARKLSQEYRRVSRQLELYQKLLNDVDPSSGERRNREAVQAAFDAPSWGRNVNLPMPTTEEGNANGLRLRAGLRISEAENALDALRRGVADAPWKKSWDALVMKRMIRYAVDNGFEQIAWINGNQQNGGQTGGDGSFFYERNLVNTTNDIIKKFGTRVGPVDMRDGGDPANVSAYRETLASARAEAETYPTSEVFQREYQRAQDLLAMAEQMSARPAMRLGIQNGFVITPELREAAMSGFAMFQQNRGQIAFGRDISQTPSVISLLKTADLSTFLHETGHFFLEATLHLANMPDADAVSVADANILMRWFAPDMTLEKWAGMTLEEKAPYHERFARGFEAYLFEGKAPSTEMRSLFRTFSSWLKSVYKSLTDLKVELTDDVRGVMDRMLASEAEIEDAHQVWALSALYDQKPEAMTEDEWARLQALGRDATEEAVEQLERRSVRDLKWASGAKSRALRQLQDEAEELRKAIRAEVTAEVMAEPVNRARNFLRRGLDEKGEPVEGAGKLDLETLKALYGDEPARPAGAVGLFAPPVEGPLWTKLRRGGKYGEVGTDGLHPDIVAGWFGYPSGQALIEDLVSAENAAEKIKGLTDQRMLERHGDLSDPQSVDKAANEAVANDARVKFVAAEEAYAAKAVGKKSLLAEAAKAIADRVVARLTLKNLKPAQYISAQIRASRAARKAAAKGDGVGVATAKRTQLINLHTGRAVSAARKEVEKDLRLFARIVTAKDATLARSRNMDLVNAARAILAKYGVGRVKNDVAGYIKAVQTYDPELFADLASVFGDLVNPERPLNELPYGEYVAIRDAVRQLWQQSRQSKLIEIDGQQRSIESVVGELNAQMDEIQPDADLSAPETTPSKSDRLGHEILGVRAMLRRVESWARGVDVRVQGPFIRYIWNPISEASDRYRRDSAAYLRRLNELMETVRDEMKPRDIAAPELGFVFKSKAVLYHAMLHTGNLSNKTKLLLGYKWGKKNEDGTLDDSRWQAFMDRMHQEGVITERDWAFVQSVWDLLEETKPGAQRAHHAMYGRYFNEITADPVVTPFGTLRGGYVPALTESYFVQDAMLRQGEDGLESNSASQMFPSTGNGFTKGREENYTQPLSLELGLLPAHIDKVVKFTHLGPAVRQAMRLLKNRKLAARLKAFDPTAQTDLLLPWLQRAAKQTVEAQGIGSGGKWVDKTARYLRGTVGMQLMFANVINTAQQLVGGPIAAAVRVKPSRLGQALWRFMRNPSEVTTAATNLSTALAVRMDNQIMETRQNINEIIDLDPNALGSARRWAIRHGYFMQSAVQNIMDPIMWTAAFDQATSEGQSTADAVRFADSVLRETQGSWNPEDVSRLETGSPFVRMFTQFGGWANMLANLNATEAQIVARGVGVRKGAGRLFYVYLMGFAAQALVGQAIADLMRGGWDDDEEDGYLDEALNWFFSSQLKLGLSAIPVAGPLANVALGGFTEARFDDRLSVSPVLSVVEGGLLAPASVYDSVVNGEKFNRTDVRNVLTLLGLVSGLPVLPLAKPLGYTADVANGGVEPTGPLDAARGAITGAPSPGSKTQ
jgi:hypothetical protein